MKYKVGDLVYFDGDCYKGVGKIVEQDVGFKIHYLVQSTQIKKEYTGKVSNRPNWWFLEEHLKPYTKKVGQKYKVIGNVDEDAEISIGDIITLISIEVDDISYYESENVPSFLMYDLDHHKCELEFYADVEDAKEQKENEMFTKDDLKVGYLVKLRSGKLVHVVNTRRLGHCLNYESSWTELGSYSDSLHSPYNDAGDIMEVYGLTEKGYNAHKFEVGDRKLLWTREEVKEMTIEEIQKVLGHKIKVVE